MKTVKILATDGQKTIRVAWLRMGTDIYGSIAHPTVKFHRSYHRDGTVHWKAEHLAGRILHIEDSFKPTGYSKDVIKGDPLVSLAHPFPFLNGGVGLDQESFHSSPADDGKKTDKVITVDSRVIRSKQKFVNFFVDLIPRGSYSKLGEVMETKRAEFSHSGMATDFHCYLDFAPWVLVTLSYVA